MYERNDTNQLRRLEPKFICQNYGESVFLMVLAEISFGEVMLSMLVFFAWVVWLMILITVFIDIFRRHDINGWMKVLWLLFVIVLPFLGVFIYLIVNAHSMAQRKLDDAAESQQQFDQYVRTVTSDSSAATQIAKAKELLDSGAITQEEFDTMKTKALAG